MAGEVAKIPKPELRRFFESAMKKHLVIALGLAVSSGIAFKLLIADPRKRRYAEFFKNFDAEKDFEEKRKKGVFQSC